MTLALVSRETTPAEAAGAMIGTRSTGRILLLDRADGSGWSHPGGWSEAGETAEETALREVAEETGARFIFTHPAPKIRIRVSERGYEPLPAPACVRTVLVYTLFFMLIATEFVPRVNAEHKGFTWADHEDIGPHLHPGCAAALRWLRKEIKSKNEHH